MYQLSLGEYEAVGICRRSSGYPRTTIEQICTLLSLLHRLSWLISTKVKGACSCGYLI